MQMVPVVETDETAAAAFPMHLGECGIPHAISSPLRRARVSHKAHDLTDHTGVGHHGDTTARVFSGKGSDSSEAPTPELTVAFATWPAKLAVSLPLVGLPQLRIGALDLIQGHPVQCATVDLLKSGVHTHRPQPCLLQDNGSLGGAA